MIKNCKKKISLIDKNFQGRDIINMPNVNFSWWSKNEKVSKTVFITDYCLDYINKITDSNLYTVAWILEPRVIIPHVYNYIELNFNKFDCILTFDSELISKCKNAKYTPYGTFWVNKTSVAKTKNISFISSQKNFAPGHSLRHEIYKNYNGVIDCYGTITGTHLQTKNSALDEYRFSIAVENSKQEGYWTEKILDCFATKTIPIYWGDKNICKFFREDGIIFFDRHEDLNTIIANCTEELYYKKLEAIEDNFLRVDSFKEPEMYIEKNYKNLLL